MIITYDKIKNQRNIDERNLPFELANQLDWQSAKIEEDQRFDYGETRYIALGLIKERVHIIVFTQTSNGIRVISFRKANKREVKHYEQNTET